MYGLEYKITVPPRALDSDSSHFLIWPTSSNLTANRNVTWVVPDSDITFTMGASSNINQNVSTTGGPTFADIFFLDNDGITFGTGLDATISYNGTDLVVDPNAVGTGVLRTSGDQIIEGQLGLMNTGISSANVIIATFTSSSIIRSAALTNTYTGTGANVGALSCQSTYNGSHANPNTRNLYTCSLNADPTTGSNTRALDGSAQLTTGQVLSQAVTHRFRGAMGGFSGNASTHTAGTICTTSIYGDVPDTLTVSGATQVSWAGFFAADVGIASNSKLILESAENSKGNSYFIFNSSTTDMDCVIDGTQTMTWDNDLIESRVPFASNTSSKVKAGTSTGFANQGGTIEVNTTAVGNVGTGEDDLMSFSVPASTLGTDLDSVWFETAGTIANNVNAKRIKVKFGATTIFDTGAAGIPISAAIDWCCSGRIVRTGAATQKCFVSFNTNNATLAAYADYATAAETLSGAVTFKLTGEAVSNNDIVEEALIIGWDAAA